MSARSVCLNDTDGDGDCAVCARNPDAPCRVTPRAAIHRLFESGRTSHRLDSYLDAFAHELAERIRRLDPIEAALAGEHAWNDAADLIDPKKESERG